MSSITDDSDPKKNRFFKDIMAFHDRIMEDFKLNWRIQK